MMKIFLLLIAFNVYSTRTTPGVDAQLYFGCQSDATGDNNTIESCFVNKPSPLNYTTADGTAITLGTVSFIRVGCIGTVLEGGNFCTCVIAVDYGDPILETDICNSCTITTITDTVFDNYFDCSNRLNGTCVGLTATGECISNINPAPVVPTPIAIPSPVADPVSTTLAPRPIPTSFPVITPTVTAVPEQTPINSSMVINPSNTPAGVTPNDQGGGTGGLNIGVVTAIGVVGGMVLSALVAYFLVVNKRKQTGKANDLRQEPTVRKEILRSEVDDNGPSSQPNGTSSAPSPRIAQNPIVETPPNNVHDVDDYDEPDKRHVYTAISDKPKRYSATTTNTTQTPATASARPSYPVNPDLHVKDQCRVVPPVVVSTPIFVSGENSHTIPFAVAVGVASSTTIAPVSTETHNNNETQQHRTLLEP